MPFNFQLVADQAAHVGRTKGARAASGFLESKSPEISACFLSINAAWEVMGVPTDTHQNMQLQPLKYMGKLLWDCLQIACIYARIANICISNYIIICIYPLMYVCVNKCKCMHPHVCIYKRYPSVVCTEYDPPFLYMNMSNTND